MRYINVAINLPVKNLFRQFTYALPPQFDYIGAGWRVIVPFARQTAEGFVVLCRLRGRLRKALW